jgi:tRNA modification GTPase
LTGEGVDHLKDAIGKHLLVSNQSQERDILISNVRQKGHVADAALAAERALNHYRNAYDLGVVSMELKHAVKQLDAVLGVDVGEDILDKIFNQFCIGK